MTSAPAARSRDDALEPFQVLCQASAPDRRERRRQLPAGIGAGDADRPLADIQREQTRARALIRRQARHQVLEVAQDRQEV